MLALSEREPELDAALAQLFGPELPSFQLERLQGDASTRTYYRLEVEDGAREPQSLIVMHLPQDAFKSDEGGAPVATDELPFVAVSRLFEDRGIPSPRVLVEDLEHHVLLLEDLGSVTFEARLHITPNDEWPDLYAEAIDLLIQLHESFSPIPPGSIVASRLYDRALLRWELEHFREWGLMAAFGQLDAIEHDSIEQCFKDITDRIDDLPTGFVHRDYQSRNLMWRSSDELAVIDFQDAMTGPRVYDLAALLCDSYVELEPALQAAMIERYAKGRGLDPERLNAEFWVVALHRKLKDAGRFVYIDRVRGNPSFLQWFPQSLVYVGRALRHLPEYRVLTKVLKKVIPGFPGGVEIPPEKGVTNLFNKT